MLYIQNNTFPRNRCVAGQQRKISNIGGHTDRQWRSDHYFSQFMLARQKLESEKPTFTQDLTANQLQ